MPIGSDNPAPISAQQADAVARLRPIVVGIVKALRPVHDPAIGFDDLVQIGLAEAFRADAEADGREGRNAYIYLRAQRRILDEVRRKVRAHYDTPEGHESVSEDERNEDESLEQQRADLARLQPLLDLLPQKQREAVQLRYLSGTNYPTLARRMGTTKSGAWRVVDRGVRRLRKWTVILEENHVTPAWSALVAQLLWRGLGGSTMPAALVRECVHIGERIKRENPLLNGQTGKAVKHAIYERVREVITASRD